MKLSDVVIVDGVPRSLAHDFTEPVNDVREIEMRDEGVRGDLLPAPVVPPVVIPAPLSEQETARATLTRERCAQMRADKMTALAARKANT